MATMESIQEKLFPSNRFRLVALSPDAKEERMTVQLIRGHYTGDYGISQHLCLDRLYVFHFLRLRASILLAVAELFVPVLDDADHRLRGVLVFVSRDLEPQAAAQFFIRLGSPREPILAASASSSGTRSPFI